MASNFTTVTKNFMSCGSCIYWSGEKEINGDLIFYDINSKGKCINRKSPAFSKTLSAYESCFEKKDY